MFVYFLFRKKEIVEKKLSWSYILDEVYNYIEKNDKNITQNTEVIKKVSGNESSKSKLLREPVSELVGKK